MTTEYSRFLIGLAAAMMIVHWGGPIADALLVAIAGVGK